MEPISIELRGPDGKVRAEGIIPGNDPLPAVATWRGLIFHSTGEMNGETHVYDECIMVVLEAEPSE